MEEKIFINNRKGQKISVLVEKPENQRGLAFIMHGSGGFKEQPQILSFAKAFLENGYTVVRFDTTNGIGESDGVYEDSTVTNDFEDLEDVIAWVKSQPWYQEPFCLAGQSLGGMCIALYAERHSEKVKALAPISTVVSGKLSADTLAHRAYAKEWQKTGWLVRPSMSKPGVIKRLKWSHMEDRLKYDLMPDIARLVMPVLLIVGEKDGSTPLEHQRLFYDKLPGRKELHIIKGARHTFREKNHLEEIEQIFNSWIQSL